MIFYVHTSMYKVDVSVGPMAYEKLGDAGMLVRLAPRSELFARSESVHITRRRRPSEQEQYSNDAFHAIDLSFDAAALEYLNQTIFGELEALTLVELSYRFTDYGFLYAVARFEFLGPVMDPNQQPTTEISRRQKRLLEDMHAGVDGRTIFSLVWQESLLEPTSQGGPETGGDILRSSKFDWDENYLYGEHLFLVGEDARIEEHKRAFAVTDSPIAFGVNEVFLSDHFPLWVIPGELSSEQMLYLLEADSLYMAEDAFHSACIGHYQRILKSFVAKHEGSFQGQVERMATASESRRRELSAPLMSSKTLRQVLIRDKLTISQIARRSEYYDADQNKYLRIYKEFYPLEQGYAIYQDLEETLKYVVHDQEVRDKEMSDSIIEMILLCFTALAFLSVVNDVDDFLLRAVPEIARGALTVLSVLLVLVVVWFGLTRLRGRR